MEAQSILTIKQLALDLPQGWKSELFMDKVPASLGPGEGCSVTFRVTPPADAQITKAYFHRDDPETDSIYHHRRTAYVTLPLPPPPVSAHVVYGLLERQGDYAAVARTPLHDDAGNAWSMPLSVVPPFSVHTVPSTQIIAAQPNPSAELNAQVRSTEDHPSGEVRAQVPSGWNVQPRSEKVNLINRARTIPTSKFCPTARRRAAIVYRRCCHAADATSSRATAWSCDPT